MKTENTVTLRGTIVHLFYTDKVAIVTIKAITELPNTPKILFFGELIEKVVANYGVDDLVEITGNIQSSKRKPNVEHQQLISIFGESIHKISDIPNRMESNSFTLAGTCLYVQKKCENLLKIKVVTVKCGHVSFVECDYYTSTPDEILERFYKGQTLRITGSVQTVKRIKGTEIRYYQNYVVRHIGIQLDMKIA